MNLRRWMLLLLLVVLGAGWWFFWDRLSLEALFQQESRLRELVETFPITSFIVGMIVYTAASLVPGTGGKAIVFGWLFGFWRGLFIVNVSLSVAAVIAFLTVRYFFYDWVHRRLPRVVTRVDKALQRDGAFYLLMLRLVHAPYTLTNYAAGATDVRTRTFWWTTQLGMLPGNIAVVLTGSQLPTLKQVAREGVWSLIDLPLWIAVTMTALIPVAVRWFIRRVRPDAPESYEDHAAESPAGTERE